MPSRLTVCRSTICGLICRCASVANSVSQIMYPWSRVMYAVVQIGSRILRSPMGMKRSVPPRFGVWASAGAASAPAASAVEQARKSRRVRWLMTFSLGSPSQIGLERRERLG
jgi:hypothetical protein